ncbi:MAG: nitroreductase family protein, partial [Mycobacterium sp.]
MYDLEEVITDRRSSRLFLRDKPVPQELIDEALALAVRAPSNSNIQPWQVVFASVLQVLGRYDEARTACEALP